MTPDGEFGQTAPAENFLEIAPDRRLGHVERRPVRHAPAQKFGRAPDKGIAIDAAGGIQETMTGPVKLCFGDDDVE
jgi:hypothetical protein